VIQEVQPHIVMVELCEQRTNILLLDEEVILREAKNINIKKIRATIKQNGMINGLMYILLLNMSAHFTRELGMAPGGEFRRAMAEKHMLDDMLEEMAEEFPTLKRVFVAERDMYLCHSLQVAANAVTNRRKYYNFSHKQYKSQVDGGGVQDLAPPRLQRLKLHSTALISCALT
ncbi:TraB domain-containing protein, partial [Operophtera brumata]